MYCLCSRPSFGLAAACLAALEAHTGAPPNRDALTDVSECAREQIAQCNTYISSDHVCALPMCVEDDQAYRAVRTGSAVVVKVDMVRNVVVSAGALHDQGRTFRASVDISMSAGAQRISSKSFASHKREISEQSCTRCSKSDHVHERAGACVVSV